MASILTITFSESIKPILVVLDAEEFVGLAPPKWWSFS